MLYQEAAEEELRRLAAAIRKAGKTGSSIEIKACENGRLKILLEKKNCLSDFRSAKNQFPHI